MIKKLKLGQKFTFFLTLVFLTGILLAGLLLSHAMQRKAEAEVNAQAEILTQTMNSVRAYTSDHIRPLLADRLMTDPQFIAETVPAYSAREVFESFRETPGHENFFYKEATLNPTNPRDLASSFETTLVNQFRQDDGLELLSGYRVVEGEKLFYSARPLRVGSESCLQCHGRPADAPQSQLTTYGQQGGFGWQVGEVVSAQTVYVPAGEVFSRGTQYRNLAIGIFVGIFAAAIAVLNGLLRRSVIQPIARLTELTRRMGAVGSITAHPAQTFDTGGITRIARRADEPGQLARAFKGMANEVQKREQNLNQAVEERTAQLAESTREAEEARAEAEQASESKSQFLANVSHELRTPLNAIIGYSEILQDDLKGKVDQLQLEDVDKIHDAGTHLLSLINDILDLSKIEAGKMELFLEEFNVQQVVTEVTQTAQPLMGKNGNRLVINCPHDIGTLYADVTKLRQALLNLLSNAAKFTENGTITLAVSRLSTLPSWRLDGSVANAIGTDEAGLTFAVTDTGIGMTPEQQAKLYQAFVQADGSTTRNYGGTGLGLVITRDFCRMMGGDIHCQSQAGIGTTFTLWLPTQVVDPQASSSQQLEPLPSVSAKHGPPPGGTGAAPSGGITGITSSARLGQTSILVIDDNASVRDLTRRSLQQAGYRVLTASDGMEGLRLAMTAAPDVILLDVMMPEMDGWSVLRALKLDPALMHIPVVMMTITDDKNLGYALGAADYLLKPVSAERLVTTLQHYRSANGGWAMVVEDNTANREMTRRQLQSAHWQVMEAENGLRALEQLEQRRPDVILLDLMMPEMDGFEFLQRLKQRPQWRSIPVVVLTAKDLTAEDRQRLQGQIQQIHQKGAYSRQTLLDEIQDLLATRPSSRPVMGQTQR
ncbi:MAG: response regulator [Cyanobacteria bacterium J06632_22]